MWARSSIAALASVVALATTGPPATKPAPAPRGPIAVYDRACLRCHGPEGVNYGPLFGKTLTDRALRQAVVDMKDGKGDIALSDDEIDAQTAYHRAIIRREPFLVVTLSTPGRLAGECTEDAKIVVSTDGKPVPVRRAGYLWDANTPPGRPREVAAVLGGHTVRLDPAKARWSHAEPLPDPKPVLEKRP